jgi:hypothetical protein
MGPVRRASTRMMVSFMLNVDALGENGGGIHCATLQMPPGD